jgi:transposase
MILLLAPKQAGRTMGGRFQDQGGLFSYVSPESRVPKGHPLRCIRQFVRDVLSELSPSFGRLYAREGRPSIPPEQLLRHCCFTCSTAFARSVS